MTTRYSDIIKLKSSRPAYIINDEQPEDWKLFIVNPNFDSFLKKVISSVRNDDSQHHKSFWVQGTYGTGKSHASAVIKHLLCDSISEIERYLQDEYSKGDHIYHNMLALREKKRLFPINLYGSAGISSIDDLSLRIQSEIVKTLQNASIDIGTLRTDFDNIASHVENNLDLWEHILNSEEAIGVNAYISNCDELIAKLRKQDTSIFNLIKEILDKKHISIKWSANNLAEWLLEAQNALRKFTDASEKYNGFLIVWDEFTEVMNSNIGVHILDRLQPVVEIMSNSNNDSYFLFITHPSALDNLDAEKQKRTLGRYHTIMYNMESVSAYKIMSHRFDIVDKVAYDEVFMNFRLNSSKLENKYAINGAESWENLQNIYPIHPSTANLATHYATVVGSETRSVFEFFADEIVRNFYDSTEIFRQKDMLTADYLWDYIFPALKASPAKYAAVTEKYNSFKKIVEDKGTDYLRVFKGILLLNALNNVSENDDLAPSTGNIELMFSGTSTERELSSILDEIDKCEIIRRDPNGVFSIRFLSLPPNEIEEITERMRESDYSNVLKVLNSNSSVKNNFLTSLSKTIKRPTKNGIGIISIQENEHEGIFARHIENIVKSFRPYEAHIIVTLARTPMELKVIHNYVSRLSQDDKFNDVCFVLVETILGDENYRKFIEYRAHAKCAENHQQKVLSDNDISCANAIVSKWVDNIKRGTCSIYFRNEKIDSSYISIGISYNSRISPIIFSSGPESLPDLSKDNTLSYWGDKLADKTAEHVLQRKYKRDVLDYGKGEKKHVQILLQNSVDDNMEIKDDIDKNHPILLVQNFIDKALDEVNKDSAFHIGEHLKALSIPPFSLYPSHACITLVSYAMRKYINRLFSSETGKELDDIAIKELILNVFKFWRGDSIKSNKLSIMLESRDARDLCTKLFSIFKPTTNSEQNQQATLKNARWRVNESVKDKGYPLWALAYMTDDEELRTLVINLVALCGAKNGQKPDQSLISKVLNGFSGPNCREINFIELYNQEDVFRKGYLKFIRTLGFDFLDTKTDSEILDYLRLSLQGEAYTITQEEVKIVITEWEKKHRDDKNSPYPPIDTGRGEEPGQKINDPETGGCNLPTTKLSYEQFEKKYTGCSHQKLIQIMFDIYTQHPDFF